MTCEPSNALPMFIPRRGIKHPYCVGTHVTSIRKNNTAARLIALAERSMTLMELASITAIRVEDLRRCRDLEYRLSSIEQLRLARGLRRHVPALARPARQLEAQVTAATRFESGETAAHMTYPKTWGVR